MKIRAHHLLCIQGFQGYGYSEEFTKNLSKIIRSLKSFSNQKIEIITECDIICSYCPYNIDEICHKDKESYEKIKEMDAKVLEKLEIPDKSTFKANEIFSITNKRLTGFDLEEICGDCSWKDKCLVFKENATLNFQILNMKKQEY